MNATSLLRAFFAGTEIKDTVCCDCVAVTETIIQLCNKKMHRFGNAIILMKLCALINLFCKTKIDPYVYN